MESYLLKIHVKAGNHERRDCPVSLRLPGEAFDLKEENRYSLFLMDEEGSKTPVQWEKSEGGYDLHWVIRNLPCHDERTFSLYDCQDEKEDTGVELIQGDKQIEVKIDGQPFTWYFYGSDIAKPYLGPIRGPYGDSYTRLDFETKEHPHQRSLWVAIGDVNGVDLWNEPAGFYGRQLHQRFTDLSSGPVFGRIAAQNLWTDFDKNPLLEETRSLTFFNTDVHRRWIDIELNFRASHGPVKFGATKEAGPLGIRVSETMTVENGGNMVNSYGSVGEGECWGRRAQWCDYHGVFGGHRLGIAVFDHPDNEGHPSYWHIRDYGLFAPNNFYFLGEKYLESGSELRYKYRVYFHDGDTDKANTAEHYQNYIHPPKVEWTY